ncbi:MAG: hypothetical protein WD826_03145 [Actinomycetota bacterium]
MRLRAYATVVLFSLAALLIGPGAAHAQFEGAKSCTSEGMVRWTPTSMWPPNHKFKTVDIKFNEMEQDGDTLRLEVLSITHSEEGSEKGSTARKEPDSTGVGNSDEGLDMIPPQPPQPAEVTVDLRKERMGQSKHGRIYTIEVACTDTGNISGETPETGTAFLKVTVPHDRPR